MVANYFYTDKTGGYLKKYGGFVNVQHITLSQEQYEERKGMFGGWTIITRSYEGDCNEKIWVHMVKASFNVEYVGPNSMNVNFKPLTKSTFNHYV